MSVEHKDTYVCDRCGATIKQPMFSAIPIRPTRNRCFRVSLEETNLEEYISALNDIRINDGFAEVSGAEVSYFTNDIKNYDLCPKCKKAFKRFMKVKE